LEKKVEEFGSYIRRETSTEKKGKKRKKKNNFENNQQQQQQPLVIELCFIKKNNPDGLVDLTTDP